MTNQEFFNESCYWFGYKPSDIKQTTNRGELVDVKTMISVVMYEAKLSLRQIAKIMEIGHRNISYYLYRHNDRINELEYRLKFERYKSNVALVEVEKTIKVKVWRINQPA